MEPTQTTGGKTGVTIAFDFLGERHQVELVQERYRDGNLAVTAYTSDPASEDFASPWTGVTVNLPWFEQEGATVLLDENNMSRAVFEKVAELGTFTGGYEFSGFCAYPLFTFDAEVMGNMRDMDEFLAADHVSPSEVHEACHEALVTVYGEKFTEALEGGYDLSGEARDMGAAKDGLSAPGATELPDRDGPAL